MGNIVRRTAWIAAVIASLAGCGAANLSDTERRRRTEGVLVTNVWADFEGTVSFDTPGHASTDLAVKPGQNLQIHWLPAGPYRWREIRSGGRFCRFKEGDLFEIIANAVNYAGDAQISFRAVQCYWRFFDRGIEMRRYLQTYHRNLLKNHELVFHVTESASDLRLPDSILEADEPSVPPPSPRAVIGKVLTDTAGFRDQICACEDAACADRVSGAMARWTREFGLDESSPRLTPEEQAHLDATTHELDACRAALAQRARAPLAPPAPRSPD